MLESLFNKVVGLKKRLQHRSFPIKFAKILRTGFFSRTPPVAAFEEVILSETTGCRSEILLKIGWLCISNFCVKY